MSWSYAFNEKIRLHVEGRITPQAAQRQERTSREILRRLEQQPGVILADEVGMGKTFVALSVALSIVLTPGEQRPVVVMIPSTLKDKWPKDIRVFLEACLPETERGEIRFQLVERPVAFFKLLDDPPERRKQVIFLTHGALSRGIRDGWMKAALIYRALYHKQDNKLREAVIRCLGSLVEMKWVKPDTWRKLMSTPLADWLKVLRREGIDPEGDNDPDTDDDPVPGSLIEPLMNMRVDNIYQALCNIPRNNSKNYSKFVLEARREITGELKELWKKLMGSMRAKLPLLILDEAHHLKNARTKFAGLFQTEEAAEDIKEITGGPLCGLFERMLFLTATPFQLGHHELCSVLDRFEAISWKGDQAPAAGRYAYQTQIRELRGFLDSAQDASLRLDRQWGRLKPEDLTLAGKPCQDLETWWTQAQASGVAKTERVAEVIRRYEEVRRKMRQAETALQPWVIRHLKEHDCPTLDNGCPRRLRLTGRAILEEHTGDGTQGLEIAREAILPFLLAARTASLLPQHRAVFAEGLASSYEAYIQTKKNRQAHESTDVDDETVGEIVLSPEVQWYLDKIEEVLNSDSRVRGNFHPKIDATVKRVLDLWKKGEKVVVFCHYIATGKALRRHISQAVKKEILTLAAAKLECGEAEAGAVLNQIGEKLFDSDSPVRAQVDHEIGAMLGPYAELAPYHPQILKAVRRYLRTPSFLARFFQYKDKSLSPEAVVSAFETQDASGLSLRKTISQFLDFLKRCSQAERDIFISAMESLQTGAIRARDHRGLFEEDELQGENADLIQPNVRLVNGTVRPQTRQKLILTFNTPFYPEILITSSVMAEGIDLHLNCRYVIHHDLCWNPSTLEQRTGRVDRIGSKSEITRKPIHIYLPYISQTQDEKMYRVVMDRERWFKVVMGEKFQVDEFTTEKLAARIPLPKKAADELAFKLEVIGDGAK